MFKEETMGMWDYIVPEDIRTDTEKRQVSISWSDGHQSVYHFEYLRWQCPCALCAGEGGAPGMLASATALTKEQTTLTNLYGVGRYAVAPVWEDGHNTGIYTFDNLREKWCQCPDCQAKRKGT